MSLESILSQLRAIPPARKPGRRASIRPQLVSLDERCMPSFSPAVSYPVGDAPVDVATGYFDSDSNLDLVTANYNSSTVTVRLGDGNGGFGNAIDYPTGSNPVSVAVGDFDDDGNDDLATANAGSMDVSVLLGDGDGTFDAPVG